MPIDFYHNPLSPPCRSVILTAKLLNIDLNPKIINTGNGDTKTPEFLKMNPQHCIPTIVDGDLVLWESRAICTYLCNQYAPESDLYPKDAKKRAVVDRMLNFDQGTFGPALYSGFLSKYRTGIEPTVEEVKNVEEKLKLFDTLIGHNKYVAGDKMTIADLTILTMVTMLELINYDLSPYPNIKNWYERMHANPDLDKMQKEVIEAYKEYMKSQFKK